MSGEAPRLFLCPLVSMEGFENARLALWECKRWHSSHQPNRVRAGFSPALPTTPRMRVRTGRFCRSQQSGTTRSPAPRRETLSARRHGPQVVTFNGNVESTSSPPCRQFGPSPCPTHYDEHLATTPSADFCAITPIVTDGRAIRGGGRVRWVLQGFRLGPQSGSHSHLELHVA
jgi:hypothetical protein